MSTFAYHVRVAFVDTDASGRIHFTAMLRYFEAAELEFLRSLGFRYTDSPADIGFPRVHVESDYRAAVGFDDELDIQVRVKRVGTSSYTLEFTAVKGDTVISNGSITAVCVSRRTGHAMAMPERLREALHKSGHNGD